MLGLLKLMRVLCLELGNGDVVHMVQHSIGLMRVRDVMIDVAENGKSRIACERFVMQMSWDAASLRWLLHVRRRMSYLVIDRAGAGN